MKYLTLFNYDNLCKTVVAHVYLLHTDNTNLHSFQKFPMHYHFKTDVFSKALIKNYTEL